MQKENILIAIAGGSGSGKSTFVQKLIENLGEKNCLIFSQDHYYKDRSHLEPKEREKINFDNPDAIDSELMFKDIRFLLSGKDIYRPNYDFSLHTRKEKVKN